MNLRHFFSIKVRKKRNFYILLFLIVLFFFAAYVHNNNIAFIVMFFLFSIGVVSFVIGRSILSKAEVRFLGCGECFAGKKCICSFLVVFPFKREVIKKEVTFSNRGYNKYVFYLRNSFPFDLVEFIKPFDVKVLVYPKLEGRGLESFLKSGSEMDEFSDLKRYEGENISKIHWPSVAKGEIQVKKFSQKDEERELVFDFNKLEGDKEKKISQIAKWVYEAKRKNLKFKVILDKEYGDYYEILEKLALY